MNLPSPDLTAADQRRPLRVMVVDDSRVQRRILISALAKAGHVAIEAEDGATALALCASDGCPDMVISDWMMPGMTGLDLCRAVRGLGRANYVYFILLTSLGEKSDVASGLAAGADDFLTKPVNGDELRARIAAGQRILAMERQLRQQRDLVSNTLAELQGLYDSINRDLVEARKLQQSLVRERQRRFGAFEVSLLLRPSGHVGGDLVGFFPIGPTRFAVFGIDVSGHGITSAMMTARLAAYLSGSQPEQNIALTRDVSGDLCSRPPDQVAETLNRIVLTEMATDAYFTLGYAEVDMGSGRLSLTQAGHPNPVILRADGRVEVLGGGGFPVGLFDGAEYAAFDEALAPGDRLILASDGFTEATDAIGRMLDDDGLAEIIARNAGLSGAAFLDRLEQDLSGWCGAEFADDVSAAVVHYLAEP